MQPALVRAGTVSPRADRSGRARYPRTARVNALLQEVVADQLERLTDSRPGLSLLTVTGVDCEPGLRHAVVYFDSLSGDAAAALDDVRPRLQAAIAHQAHMKRTPLLSFEQDPAIDAARKVEAALRRAARHVPRG